ncbi:hypothetical protein SODALDRAFT_335732 [Sodiomyces alkalinus F11]|uniref:Transcriptional regulatory protein RXT2 N-terminal domain-containing protein n=1 Tax=Sodiomyces alkalinus (strain CBS 110278 / VKM F-3762 / F11) TaxID=1314773 RepID=A0A3N2PQ42_SODAK|nr:hypothetical protein SODALDRAFT_335732 [Sodiomyces alkalinus F11]ROT36631.1 hypothetical protein SODALDRAFT_335732 [Sodiomyces alkalinus F11]
MAAQQVLFGETVAGMKKALKRTAYESDSDNEIQHYSNRGHKLKKRALFAHQGQLVPPSGPEAYKEDVEYAGQIRTIINRNPPLLDDEGYEVDSDDDEERLQEAMASAAELNPYANIRLEQVLAPLTAATDLPTHPILSKPFTSKTLNELTDQSCNVMRKENKALWRIEHLFTKLIGDHTWVPCEMMLGPNDIELYSDDYASLSRLRNSTGSPATLSGPGVNGQVRQAGPHSATTHGSPPTHGLATEKARIEDAGDGDIYMTDAIMNGSTGAGPEAHVGEDGERDPGKIKAEKRPANGAANEPDTSRHGPNGEVPSSDDTKHPGGNEKPSSHSEAPSRQHDQGPEPTAPGGNGAAIQQDNDGSTSTVPQPGQGTSGVNATTTTTTTTNNNNSEAMSVAAEMLDELFVHPLFRPPPNAQVDRGGLSEAEAEDMRRLVALYVQKQEEICRGAHKLHEGLLKANRLRKTVLQWAKAEAHCGPNRDMSDGEDWYDKEEWGLTEDLKKGQDEEEEDTTTAPKKTRNRRHDR